MAYYSNEGTPIHAGAAGVGSSDEGKLMSFRDGSLGNDEGYLSSFRDGSLGDEGYLSSFRDGSLGRRKSSGCRGCGSLGAAAAAVLDMNKPEVVLEVKSLMSFLGGPAMNQDPAAAEMLLRTNWDEAARVYMGQLLAAISSTGTDTNTWAVAPLLTPSSIGIHGMVQMYASTGVTPDEIARTIPNISAFMTSTGANPANGSVIPPAKTGLKTAHMALIGVGVLAVAFLLMRKKK